MHRDWLDDPLVPLKHGASIYADNDRNNKGASVIQLEAMLAEDGQDFERSIPCYQQEQHADHPITWSDLEALLRWIQQIIGDRDHLSLDLVLWIILDGGSQSEWARRQGVTPQAAHNRLAKVRRLSPIVAKILPVGKQGRLANSL